jgi:hypothetical protein
MPGVQMTLRAPLPLLLVALHNPDRPPPIKRLGEQPEEAIISRLASNLPA